MLNKRIRRAAVRRCLVIAVVAVPLVSLAAANPTWAKAAGIDVWNVPKLEAELAAADRDRERLDGVDSTMMNRIAAKEAIVAELIAGRATLAEATSHFLSLNTERPGFIEVLRADHPDCSDEECNARNVIGYVMQRVTDPVERESMSCRLAVELAELLQHSGAR